MLKECVRITQTKVYRLSGITAGICVSQNKVFVTQHSDIPSVRELIHYVCSLGKEDLFMHPLGLDVSDKLTISICDNKRVKVLTKELKYHSMLGRDLRNTQLM